MYYMNEQITKTFEHLLNLCYKYHSVDRFILSPRKSRILYRINQDKLDKYHSQNNSKYDNKEKKDKQIDRKTISTQTIFNKNLIHPSINILSIISKETNEIDISSSLSNINKPTNSSSIEIDSSDKSSSDISIKTNSNQIQNSSKPNCRVYIRSIVRHMLNDETSDKEK